MEEDIKILEDFIKYFEAEAISTKYRRNISITVGEDDIQAIENLIKGYRELEEENTDLKDLYIRTAKHQHKIGHTELGDYMLAQIGAIPTFTTWEKYITWVPKSKIKEKIEELEKKILEYEAYRERGKETDVEYYDFIANSARKKVLQELMEDK